MQIKGVTVVSAGRFPRLAQIHDDEWIDKRDLPCPNEVMAELVQRRFPADVFTFAQEISDAKRRFRFKCEPDNAAVVPITAYEDWWENRLPQVTRKNVRRSAKRGVITRQVALDDRFIQGVVEIYNETRVRQGRPFAHFGKDFATVREEISSLADRSLFIGAFVGEELIGFVKLVLVDGTASILHIIAKDQHFDKRPVNALIAKAVEVCVERKLTHLVYGKFTYGNKTKSLLREFKRRNGFEELAFPRYYIPLTPVGRIALALKLHRGLIGWLPANVIEFLLELRSRWIAWRGSTAGYATSQPEEKASEV